MQTVPPRRASLARATALYLERKATSEAGTPLATSESGTPVASSSTTTPLRSPYSRAYSTGANSAAVGIRTLPVTPSRGSLSLAPVPECTADSPARRLFHSRSEGGLGSCSTVITTAPAPAVAGVEAADAAEAVSKTDAPQTAAEEPEAQLGAPLATDDASGPAAGSVGKTATSSPFAASTAEQTPDKQQLQHQEQEPATEPRAGSSSSIRSMSSRKGRDSQPGSSRLGLFYSPQTSRQPSLRRGSDTDTRKPVSVRALAANFDAAASAAAATVAAGAGAGGVRGYRVRSETGYAGRKAPAAAAGRGAGGKWQQLGAAGASASPTPDRPGAGSKSKWMKLLWA